ncbi:MAG TPA: amidase [Nitrososphaerales archaeon]|nr:amidase [Nitrososphaerales archaeon]
MGRPTILGLAAGYRNHSASPVDVTGELLSKVESTNSGTNWFITVLRESALRAAEKSAARHRDGKALGPLDGVPIAVKDIFYIEGVKCTAGSKILSDNIARYDAPSIRRLKGAGAIIIGTTNLHEFAAGVTSDNPHYGPVRNPWSSERVAGGSSGGSAACVAEGYAAAALGTDTAGSVRIPAALCGVIGVKPTYGLVSRLGVVPLAPSLDTVGVLGTTSVDAAILLDAISGHEEGDITTGDVAPTRLANGLGRSKGARVGVPKKFFEGKVSSDVASNFEVFLSRLKEMGCGIVEVEMDCLDEVYPLWLPIRRAEATAFHLKWLDSTPGLYGADVRNLLELGREVRAVDYVSALNARPGMIEKALVSMKDVDLLALPTTCVPAPRIGEADVEISGARVEVYRALNTLTLPFNYLGFPSLTVPIGLVRGLPLGAQLAARLFDEVTALSLAHRYETSFGPMPAPPPFSSPRSN